MARETGRLKLTSADEESARATANDKAWQAKVRTEFDEWYYGDGTTQIAIDPAVRSLL
jgi:hypothetical protein